MKKKWSAPEITCLYVEDTYGANPGSGIDVAETTDLRPIIENLRGYDS